MTGAATTASSVEPFEAGAYRGSAQREALASLHRDVLPDPMAAARAGRPLRTSVSRLTSRVVWSGLGPVLLKVHRTRSLGERLSSWVRASRARQEWEAMSYLRAAGVPVPAALAMGEARRWGVVVGSFFAARYVPGLHPVHEALGEQPADKRSILLGRLARLLRGMHDRGFDHRDLHSGNVLAAQGPGDRCALLIVDLHRSRLGRWVSERARRRAVAQWLHSLTDHLDAAGRRTWLGAYLGDEDAAASWMPIVERDILRREQVRRKSRGKRCFKESTIYTRDVGAGRGARRRDLPMERLEAVLRAHDEALTPGAPGFLKRSRKGVVTRHGDIVVKERCPASALDRLRDRLAPRRHAAGYRNAHMLGIRGVGTARPLAWLHRGGRVFTLLEDLSGRPRLDHLARDLYARGTRAEQARLRDASAAWLGGLHRDGIYHGDLKGVNVLVDAVSLSFSLIDTDACRFHSHAVDTRRRIKNLAQLAASIPRSVSRTERLRWYRRYAVALDLPGDERAVARAVAEAVARKIAVVDEPIE